MKPVRGIETGSRVGGHPLVTLSRFLNISDWSTKSVICATRNRVIQEILSDCPKGRKPFLQVIIDLTTRRESRKI